MFKSLFNKKKAETKIGLDIGTKAVKGLVFKDNSITGHSFCYLDKYSAFDSDFFEADVAKRALNKVMDEMENQTEINCEECHLLLPPDILKARTVNLEIERKEKESPIKQDERKKIGDQILKKAKDEVASKLGVLSSDVYSKYWEMLETNIDGYKVDKLVGFKGKKIKLKILTIFFLKNYFDRVKEIQDFLEWKIEFAHPVQGIFSLGQESQIYSSGIFLDIGGTATQVFVFKKGELVMADGLNMGGETFTTAILGELGLTEDRARILKERYSRAELSRETEKGIEEIISGIEKEWSNRVVELLNGCDAEILPNNIYLFGGGGYQVGIDAG